MTTLPATDRQHRFRAMASNVTVRVIDPTPSADAAIAEVERLFAQVERSCTRFDDTSDLMRANANATEWTTVAPECLGAISSALDAHLVTGGAFDPRVLKTLTALGYDRSLDFVGGSVTTAAGETTSGALAPWIPDIDVTQSRVRIGPEPIDLGGIGKGYAVRLSIAALAGCGRSALVEAGGDLATYGDGPDRDPGEPRGWRAAVEDPRGGDTPIAVLDVTNAAAATSSIRLRRWRSGGRDVHHLIDPRTGQPSASQLLAVTVIGDDTAWAEVWTKVCFLAGVDGIRDVVEREGLTAYWVDTNGSKDHSESMRDRILWEARS
jgi:thiamine biosynthesis lipoprotein